MKVGIIGWEFAGKKSLFTLMTGIEQGPGAREAVGVVDVPDERIDALARFYDTTKKTYSKIEFYCIPSLTDDSKANSQILLAAKEMDMFAVVVRQFSDQNVYHPLGSIDVQRDYARIKDELIFADLFLVETRRERLEKQLKGKPADQGARELALMDRLKEHLEKGTYLSGVALDADEEKIVRTLMFLTRKPIFAVVNCDEDKVTAAFPFPDGVESIPISVKIEKEIQGLDEASRSEFLATLGLTEPSLARLIKFAYAFGSLISFITAGPQEVHSWTIRKGATALKAAGTIHSDLEKGFIRAEVVSTEDLIQAGSEAKARETGKYHLEGKEYIVKDGDILEIRFSK